MKQKKSNPLLLTLILLLAALVPLALVFQLNDPRLTYLVPSVLKSKIKKNIASKQYQSPFEGQENKILFAKNGETEIYKIQEGDQWKVVIQGQESALYDSVDNPTFSPDGTRFAYSASLNNQEFVVVDNTPQGNKYQNIKQIIFSPDGTVLAYLAENTDGSLVIINSVEGKTYQNIGTLETETGITYLVFTPNGNDLVYRAEEGDKTFLVVNTDEGQQYTEITTIYFSSDGTQIAYYAQDGTTLVTVVDNKVVDTQTITETSGQQTPSGNQPPSSPQTGGATKIERRPRNVGPNIDDQPEGLIPVICGQDSQCNF